MIFNLLQSFSPSKFSEVCQKNSVWLHLEGHALAALALVNDNGASTPNADSLSLTIGSWIGVPAVPFVTLYKVCMFFNFFIFSCFMDSYSRDQNSINGY